LQNNIKDYVKEIFLEFRIGVVSLWRTGSVAICVHAATSIKVSLVTCYVTVQTQRPQWVSRIHTDVPFNSSTKFFLSSLPFGYSQSTSRPSNWRSLRKGMAL